MAKGEDTRGHPNRQVHRERFIKASPSKRVWGDVRTQTTVNTNPEYGGATWGVTELAEPRYPAQMSGEPAGPPLRSRKFNPRVSTLNYERGATMPGTRRNTSGRVVTKRESTGWS